MPVRFRPPAFTFLIIPTGQQFFYVVWVEDADGKNERPLVLTPKMLEYAEVIAEANPEDIPQKSIIQDMLD